MRSISIVGAILLIAGIAQAQTPAPNYPFAGKWDCEVATFTFTNTTYNNGSETLRMTKVEKKGAHYELTFPKNYRVMVGNFKGNTMSWLSAASGDGFTCKRTK